MVRRSAARRLLTFPLPNLAFFHSKARRAQNLGPPGRCAHLIMGAIVSLDSFHLISPEVCQAREHRMEAMLHHFLFGIRLRPVVNPNPGNRHDEPRPLLAALSAELRGERVWV